MTTPRSRQAYDAADRGITPRIEGLAHSELFAIAAGATTQLQRVVRQEAARATRRWLRLLNLPAGTDVSRILAEVGQLRQQMRDLSRELHSSAVSNHANATVA